LRQLIVIVISYILGSIPFGYLIVSARTGSDIRQSGSGGTGATNVTRRAGKAAGVLTLLLDALKGAASVIIATLVLSGMDQADAVWWIGLAGIVAMLGHIFPVWLGFRGGKGVATGVGVLVCLVPISVALAGLLFLIVVVATRYVSLGSITAALSIPLFVYIESLFHPVAGLLAMIITTLAGASLIVYAHRGNIQRLRSGTERKFGR
jgi:glycerol-3-phosphate acyltransferase PlsY